MLKQPVPGVVWVRKTAAEVPPGEGWLTREERQTAARFKVPKRLSDWRLGRWTAKCALILAGEAKTPDEVAILASPSGAPEAFRRGARVPRSISLAHANGDAVCTVGPEAVALGADLEEVVPRSPAFLDDHYTPAERRFVHSGADENDSALRANVVWSGKEAALKALREGMRLPPRSVEVSAAAGTGSEWRPLVVTVAASGTPARGEFSGWWRVLGRSVFSIVQKDQQPTLGFPLPLGGYTLNRKLMTSPSFTT